MKTAGKIARIVFLALAFVSYARPSQATPAFIESCSDQCYGSARWLWCSYLDYWDYPYGPQDESSCWEGDYWQTPYYYYEEYCRWLSGNGSYSFSNFTCNDGPTRGTFLCTFDDQNCY